jgi:hypothetical protein
MKKSDLLRALQTEIRRHTLDTFVENPPAMAQGGKGVVVPGCPTCRKRLFTMQNFMEVTPLTFVDTPRSIAQGGNGVVTPGCPACRKRLFTMLNFIEHLCQDILPATLDKLSSAPDNKNDAATDTTHSADSNPGSV